LFSFIEKGTKQQTVQLIGTTTSHSLASWLYNKTKVRVIVIKLCRREIS